MVEIGDIVKTKEKEGNRVLPAVVTRVIKYRYYGEERFSGIEVLFSDGTYGRRSANKFEVTGRHINMQSVLNSIR